MPSLDKRKILKSASQLQKSTSPRPKNNYSQFGVSDRSSLSKKGNHNGGLGHGYCYNITVYKYGNEYCEKVKYSRQAGAGINPIDKRWRYGYGDSSHSDWKTVYKEDK